MADEQRMAARPAPVPYQGNGLKTDQNLIEALRKYAHDCRSALRSDLLHAAADRLEQLTRFLP